jgi:hypothetical protein
MRRPLVVSMLLWLSGCTCGPYLINAPCDGGSCPAPYFCDTSVSDAGFCTRACNLANRANECMISGDEFEGACERVAPDGGGRCTSFCGAPFPACPAGLSCSPLDGGPRGPVCL